MCLGSVQGPELGPRPRVAKQGSRGLRPCLRRLLLPGPASEGKALPAREAGGGAAAAVPAVPGPFSVRNNRVLISQTNPASPSLCTGTAALLAALASSHWIVTAGAVDSSPAGLSPGLLGLRGRCPTRQARRTEYAPELRGLQRGPAAPPPPAAPTDLQESGRSPICAAAARTEDPGLEPLRSAPTRLHPAGASRVSAEWPGSSGLRSAGATRMCRGGRGGVWGSAEEMSESAELRVCAL